MYDVNMIAKSMYIYIYMYFNKILMRHLSVNVSPTEIENFPRFLVLFIAIVLVVDSAISLKSFLQVLSPIHSVFD